MPAAATMRRGIAVDSVKSDAWLLSAMKVTVPLALEGNAELVEEPQRRSQPQPGQTGEHRATNNRKNPAGRVLTGEYDHLADEDPVEEASQQRMHQHPRVETLEPQGIQAVRGD